MQDCGIWLPPGPNPAAQVALPGPLFVKGAEKVPARSASVGTVAVTALRVRTRSHSKFVKKFSRLFQLLVGIMGPPTLKPNVLKRSGSFGTGLPAESVALEKKFLASNTSFLKNSHKAPWYSVPPDLVTRFTWPPPLRPNSAV